MARWRAQLAFRGDVAAGGERADLYRVHLSTRRVARPRAAAWTSPRLVGDGEVLSVRPEGSPAAGQAQRAPARRVLRDADRRPRARADGARDLEAGAAQSAQLDVRRLRLGEVLALRGDVATRDALRRARIHGDRRGPVLGARDDD